jgi:hypothetical protein
MTTADIEGGKKNLAVYVENFYRVKREQLSGHAETPVTIDPQKVAGEARAYMDSERTKGHIISTTDAVAHVLERHGQ